MKFNPETQTPSFFHHGNVEGFLATFRKKGRFREKESMRRKRVWVRLPKELVEWLDAKIQSKQFKDYSHAPEVLLTKIKEAEGK